MQTNYESRYFQSKVYWIKENPLAITDAKAIKNGVTLVLKNTGNKPLSLMRIHVQDEFMPLSNVTDVRATLEPGMSIKLNANASFSPIEKRKFVSLQMRFDYDAGAEKSLIGKDRLILPAPNICNDFGEICYSPLDCCNVSAGCDYGTCGSCGWEGMVCNASLRCCAEFYCYSIGIGDGECRQKPDLVPAILSAFPMDPYGRISLQVSDIGVGPSPASSTNVSYSGPGCAGICSWIYATPQLESPIITHDFETPFSCINATSITVTTDYPGIIPESNESNNIVSSPVSCWLPNLVPNATGFASTQTQGVDFTINITTHNIGTWAANNSTTRVTYTGGIIVSPGSNLPVGYLNIGASNSTIVTARCTSAPATTTLTVTADYGNAIIESDESNTLIGTINCVAAPLPDLIANATHNAANPQPAGVNFTITIITKNNATVANAPSSATNITASGGTFNINQSAVNVSSLAPNSWLSRTVTGQCQSVGIRTITVSADHNNAITESSETNNGYSLTVNCSGWPAPNLDSSVLGFPAGNNLAVNATYTLTVRTTNIGNAPSVNGSLTQVENMTSGYELNGTLQKYMGNLNPTAYADQQINITCRVPQANRQFRVKVDNTNNVSESLDGPSYNWRTYGFNCALMPDLVANYTGDLSLLPLDVPINTPTIIDNITTYNIGLGASVATNTRLYLNSSSGDMGVPALQPGNFSTNRTTFTCTSLGLYNGNPRADNWNFNVESDENNNDDWFRFPFINCTPHDLPELIIRSTDPQISINANVGEAQPSRSRVALYEDVNPIGAFAYTQNVGNNTAAPSTTVVYTTPASSFLFGTNPVWTIAVPTLLPGGYSTNSTNARCNGRRDGIVLTAVADNMSVVPEMIETNNARNATYPFNCTRPDLYPDILTLPPWVVLNVSFNISNVRTSNIGGISTGPPVGKTSTTRVGVIQHYSSGWIWIQQINVSVPGVSSGLAATNNSQIPLICLRRNTCPTSDTYTIGAMADSWNDMPELSEANTHEYALDCRGPDATVSISTTPAQPMVDQLFNLTFTTNNAGTYDAAPSTTRPNFNGAPLTNIAVPALAPSASNVTTFQVTCPRQLSAPASATSDLNDVLYEKCETNNLGSLTITCRGPDLYASANSAQLSGSKTVSTPFNVTITTTNTGGSGYTVAPATTTLVTFGTNSYPIPIPTLAAGANNVTTVTVQCPTSGTIPFSVGADSSDAAAERNETNNIWTYAAGVTCN